MEKKRLVVNYNNVSPEVLEAIRLKYPLGYSNHVIKVKTRGDDFFYAITVDTADASYLVKVPVKIDTKGNVNDDDNLEDINNEKENEDNFPDNDPNAENDE
ncbi:hypothetical protein [Lentimicrobium sp.]|jgi:hypothetical protein|uniref:hypothetical protein n=1 Tax=Lentimicrobium sp. TaxID=2034841 RepID=UPI0025DBE1DE|nr:hypothetical protein [Lentimicrobium sp.]MCO5255367.1 hypothetical protein [Lentimicrobium sp.]MCO5261386.1 hypothetical protein [Lentimicrobium sp.]HPF63292.1 hypothetical protein [Lentimicrobium sp.]HPJ61669.1 hypothetical protein [Lentimicrobium sp.]HPR24912.1 hypothetical protein [Lentimicrobium sp.]